MLNIPAAAIKALIVHVFRVRWREPTYWRNRQVARPGRALLIAGLTLLVLGPLVAWLMLVTFPEFAASASAERTWVLVAAVTVLFGLFVVVRSVGSVVVISKFGLIQRTTTLGIRRLAWRNVKSVEYLSFRGALRIRGDRAEVTVGLAASGVARLLDKVEASVVSVDALATVDKTRQILRDLERTGLF